MIDVLYGALVAVSATAGLFFLRFWRDTRERLFVLFAAAFWLLAANWLGLALVRAPEETRAMFYLLRLGAFALIVVAVLEKNGARERDEVG